MNPEWPYIAAEAVGVLKTLRDLRKLPPTQLPRVDDILRRWDAEMAQSPEQLVLL